jgi:hypothetical protein
MEGLQAEQINNEFLKNFLSETIYQIAEDKVMPASINEEESVSVVPKSVAEVETSIKKVSEQPQTTAALPKIPKQELPEYSENYRVFGQNKKGVVVLVTVPDATFQKLPQLGFLQKILTAIGLGSEDVAYMNNLSGGFAKFEELVLQTPVNYIISFASRLETDLPHEKFTLYNPVKVGVVPVVFSLGLEKLEEDQEQKRLLWNALQQMFL